MEYNVIQIVYYECWLMFVTQVNCQSAVAMPKQVAEVVVRGETFTSSDEAGID